jgi:hypothetical protein
VKLLVFPPGEDVDQFPDVDGQRLPGRVIGRELIQQLDVDADDLAEPAGAGDGEPAGH